MSWWFWVLMGLAVSYVIALAAGHWISGHYGADKDRYWRWRW